MPASDYIKLEQRLVLAAWAPRIPDASAKR